jgi:hypothetical protein
VLQAAKDQELRDATDSLAAAKGQLAHYISDSHSQQNLNPALIHKLMQLAPLLEGCKELTESLNQEIKDNVTTTTTSSKSSLGSPGSLY